MNFAKYFNLKHSKKIIIYLICIASNDFSHTNKLIVYRNSIKNCIDRSNH